MLETEKAARKSPRQGKKAEGTGRSQRAIPNSIDPLLPTSQNRKESYGRKRRKGTGSTVQNRPAEDRQTERNTKIST